MASGLHDWKRREAANLRDALVTLHSVYSDREVKRILADLLGRDSLPRPSSLHPKVCRELVKRLIVLGLA